MGRHGGVCPGGLKWGGLALGLMLLAVGCSHRSSGSNGLDGTQSVAGVPLPSVSVQVSKASVSLGDAVLLTPTITGGSGRLVVLGGQYVSDAPLGPGLLPAKDGAVQSGKTYVGFPLATTQYFFEAINSAGQTMGQTVSPTVSNVSVSVVPPVASVLAGESVNFAAQVAGAVDSRVTWSFEGAGSIDGNGLYTAPSTPGTYKIWATSIADPTRKAYALAAVRQVAVGVTPHALSLHPGWQSDLRADVVGTLNRGVTWSCTGGSVNGTGSLVSFLAPLDPGGYTVRATSVDDPRMYDESVVSVLPLPVAQIATDAGTIPQGGSATLRIAYSGGAATVDQGVGAVPPVGPDGTVQITVAPHGTTTYTLTVTSPLGATATATATVNVQGLAVSILPSSAALSVSGGACATNTLDFHGMVLGGTDGSIIWSCTGGTIDSHGLYTSPSTPGTYTVTARSVQDPGRSASAVVTVVDCPAPSVEGNPALINPGQTSTLMPVFGAGQVGVMDQGIGSVVSGRGVAVTPAVTTTYNLHASNAAGDSVSVSTQVQVQALSVQVTPGTLTACVGDGAPISFLGNVLHAVNGTNPGIHWSCSGGSIDQNGVWTPPGVSGTFLVTATSVADPSKYANALVTVHDCVGITINPGAATVQEGGVVNFSATVTGSANTAVTWQASAGTIDGQGVYTAPPGPGQAGTYTVTARSAADPSQTATAVVTVTPMARGISVSPATVTLDHGASQEFSATVTGLSNTSVSWAASAGVIDGAGNYTAPASGGTGAVITATSVADGTLIATANVTLNPIAVSLTPSSANVVQGATTQLTASVTGTASSGVTFLVDGVPGGNSTVGTISVGGLYSAPASGTGSHVVTATSVADPTKSATASVTVVQTVAVNVSPGSVTMDHGATQAFTATVTGSTSDTTVTWSASAGSITGAGIFTAPNAGAGPVTITARSNGDSSKTATATVVLNPITIGVTPASAVVVQGATKQFTATISGSVVTGATWSVDGIPGGDPTVGTISASGLYTAPNGSTGAHTLQATSLSDPSRTATATVTVNAPLAVSISPSGVSLDHGAAQSFVATVTGTTGDQTVTWSASAGAITSGGVFTAPSAGTGPVTVTATANQDGTTIGSAVVNLNPISVVVSPSSPVVLNGGSQAFSATVAGAVNGAVTWSVDGVPGGNATVGTISGSGVYTAPASGVGTHGISAISASDPTKSGGSTITVNQPVVITVSPANPVMNHGGTQTFSATVTGTIASTAVTWEASAGSIDGSGVFTAPTSASTGSATVTARSVADPTKTGTTTVTLNAMSVAVLPGTASVGAGASQQFTASVSGAANTSVVWYVDGALWGNATVGTIDASGLYVAPGTSGSHTVTAASVADSTQTASAAVTVTAVVAPSVVVNPPDTVCEGGSHTFTASVSGLGSTAVTWAILQVNGAAPVGDPVVEGVMDAATGAYTFPTNSSTDLQLTVQATSLADGSYSAVRTVHVLDGALWDNTSPAWLTLQVGSSRLLTNWVWADAPAGATITWSASGGSILVSGADSYWQAPAVPGSYVLTATLNLGAGGCDRVLNFPVTVAEVPDVQAGCGTAQDLGDVDVWPTFGGNTKAFTAPTSIVSWLIEPDLDASNGALGGQGSVTDLGGGNFVYDPTGAYLVSPHWDVSAFRTVTLVGKDSGGATVACFRVRIANANGLPPM